MLSLYFTISTIARCRQLHFTVYFTVKLHNFNTHDESHHAALGELPFPDTKSALKIQINIPWTNLKTV